MISARCRASIITTTSPMPSSFRTASASPCADACAMLMTDFVEPSAFRIIALHALRCMLFPRWKYDVCRARDFAFA
ncbi:MAG: hypothetical protein DWI09_05835 [Planctomycetota bacterium]|nr:MAG: hypothetical protein DWI09_05835 [Planctomycetota bacterium]